MECHWLLILAVADKSKEKHGQCGLTFIHSFYVFAPSNVLSFERKTPCLGHIFIIKIHLFQVLKAVS